LCVQEVVMKLKLIAHTTITMAYILACVCVATAQSSPPPLNTDDKIDDDLIRAIIIQQAMKTISTNIDGSKRETGEMDKLIRAMSGVSIKDIKQYGLCGGANSEVRKLLGTLCPHNVD
jgi:hypothetical protein